MRNFIIIFIVFSITESAWGADPLIGTWKLDVTRSKIPSSMQIPGDLVEVYRETGDGLIEYHSLIGQEAGPNKYTWPVQGGMAKREPVLPEGLAYVETLVAPGDWYVTVLQNGVQVFIIHKTFSDDGKTMYQTRKGVNDQGERLEAEVVYTRQ